MLAGEQVRWNRAEVPKQVGATPPACDVSITTLSARSPYQMKALLSPDFIFQPHPSGHRITIASPASASNGVSPA